MLQIGSLVDNKYKILSEVGHGGMSVVYLAINERANKTWAVKEVRKDGTCDFEAVKQGLIVETDMLKRLNHDHLPSIIDVIDTDDSFLIVMDYIEGQSLQSVLKKGGAQPQDLVVKWAIQLCDVLGYLHSREPAIIYRDMKPANVMLKPSGDVTLIDFGTAREFKNRAMVEDTTCLGTRGYAAPEQFGGRGQTDARTDIYCLGATLYHLVTGHSPAEPPYEIKPLSYWDPNMFGSGLEMIINKCCQQDPEARYQNCAELMFDLEHINELNLVEVQKRNRKWAAFVASAVACCVGIAGMLGFHLAKSHQVTRSYDFRLEQAQKCLGDADITSMKEHIAAAISVDPTKREAYESLLDAIEMDGKLDYATEMEAINACFNVHKKNEQVTYLDQLAKADQAAYADVNFRIGKLLALMGDGGDANMIKSAAYFSAALDKGGMRTSEDPDIQKKAKLAEALHEIGSKIGQVSDKGGNVFAEQNYDYTDLWNALVGLEENFKIDTMDSYAYGIALYSRIAYMTYEHSSHFKDFGVNPDDMLALVTRLETALNTANAAEAVAERFKPLFDTAFGNVNTAKNRLMAMGAGEQTVQPEGGAE